MMNNMDNISSSPHSLERLSSSKTSQGQQQQQQQEDEFGWDWEETMSVATANTGSAEADFWVDSLPPQLHPAVSLGIRRVSSCAYFSLQGSIDNANNYASELDLYSLSSEVIGANKSDNTAAAADILYHDILMVVLTYLDAESLAAFSETARRANFEVYYFLQLQLQRALLEDDLLTTCSTTTADNDRLSAIAGSWAISRLASLDPQDAHNVVQEYLDSNCTLRTMPLSHSLAYIREVLRRNGFPGAGQQQPPTLTTSAQAALLIGLVGAATVMSGNAEVVESFGTELPNMLFGVGFVGSLMGAARHRWETTQNRPQQQQEQPLGQEQQNEQAPPAQARDEIQSTMRETAEQMREAAEQMARALQDMLQQIRSTATNNNNNNDTASRRRRRPSNNNAHGGGSISRRMYEALVGAPDNNSTTSQQQQQQQQTLKNEDDNPQSDDAPLSTIDDNDDTSPEEEKRIVPVKKMPSGCVGAYFRAIRRASNSITRIVKLQRRSRFDALPNKEMVARSFIDACCSDESIHSVRDLVQVRGTIDADGFYVGSDGTETCALHASAFHGATQVLEFLCGGIDERDASQDEGLCCVNLQDANGWTALHFAAGANCVESARILADRGANLSVVAENGYTPLQWAQRLRNMEVAEELQRRLEQTDPYHAANNRWMGASQPLSMIAHRFFGFALVPTH
ncbi:Ankyrin Repeat Protein [Seminavis robusta]|uniref:Ankyrin Repeat Protein n=1 Tax=Seminavis robusta TaxID=568900 RepID=A0A9N8EAM6_9STRA|nr:Ankyrin Repeat Protein [Seminavis robusta]|eukprot:Sro692_g188190.1 Ankyrin Repeat Protein (685) ;mRNA; r:49378-51521